MHAPFNILFMGSGEIACPSLERLLAGPHHVVAVVTQPDRPRGRNLNLAACPVKVFSEAHGVPVLTPEKVGADGSVQEIRDLAPDLIVVAAYGQYIKPAILELPPLGAINLHPSLLPRYRGAAPIQMAVANGDSVTGVTILYVSQEMDAGDMILQREVPIAADDTTATLIPRLAELGAELVGEAIELIRAGAAPRVPQDESRVVHVKKLTKEDGRIDWHLPAAQIHNRMRGFTPWPGCYCEIAAGTGMILKVRSARVEPGNGEPGTVLDCNPDGPLIATGADALRLLTVQPPGKKPMTGGAFLCGHALALGDRIS